MIGATGCPVVSLTVISPGPVKSSPVVERVFGAAASTIAVELAARGWRVPLRRERHARTGPELLLAVDATPLDLKEAMVSLEEDCRWGRLWDADVIGPHGPIARSELGRNPRSCLVCQEVAAACARSRRHHATNLADAVAAIVGSKSPQKTDHRLRERPSAAVIGRLAAEALRTEARLTPKPGLVDSDNPGAHSDMTLQTLLDSADALEPWLVAMAELGGVPQWTVTGLRQIGRRAEQDMLQATGGVNTHKGALFSLGWWCAILAGAPSADEPCLPLDASHRGGVEPDARLRTLLTPLLNEWLASAAGHTKPTHGERALAGHGLHGVRGEAAAGFPTVLEHGLPRLRAALDQGWALDDALLAALVALMSRAEDTNLVARGGIAALQAVHEWASRLNARERPADVLRAELDQANEQFVLAGLSPGGCADLLATTWFLHVTDPIRAVR